MVLMTPQFEKKIVWNGARTTGNPVYPHGESSLFFSVSVKVLPVTPLLSGVFVRRVCCAYFVRFEGAGVMRRFLWCTREDI